MKYTMKRIRLERTRPWFSFIHIRRLPKLPSLWGTWPSRKRLLCTNMQFVKPDASAMIWEILTVVCYFSTGILHDLSSPNCLESYVLCSRFAWNTDGVFQPKQLSTSGTCGFLLNINLMANANLIFASSALHQSMTSNELAKHHNKETGKFDLNAFKLYILLPWKLWSRRWSAISPSISNFSISKSANSEAMLKWWNSSFLRW